MIYLLIALPLASVVMGIVMLYVAFSGEDEAVARTEQELSKTSWQTPAPQRSSPR